MRSVNRTSWASICILIGCAGAAAAQSFRIPPNLNDSAVLARATALGASLATLDDRRAALAIRELSASTQRLEGALQLSVQRAIAPLIVQDDARRYITERNVQVFTPEGAVVCALIMRPRAPRPARLPALLTFTIYVDSAANVSDVRRAASNAYIGVTAFTRGKACSPQAPVPYRFDGEDAAALIEWIAHQPWSDGRVGMYGGSYNGFTTWAATKHSPKALKAIILL